MRAKILENVNFPGIKHLSNIDLNQNTLNPNMLRWFIGGGILTNKTLFYILCPLILSGTVFFYRIQHGNQPSETDRR
jgi:hypothetical protein